MVSTQRFHKTKEYSAIESISQHVRNFNVRDNPIIAPKIKDYLKKYIRD